MRLLKAEELEHGAVYLVVGILRSSTEDDGTLIFTELSPPL